LLHRFKIGYLDASLQNGYVEATQSSHQNGLLRIEAIVSSPQNGLLRSNKIASLLKNGLFRSSTIASSFQKVSIEATQSLN
jgi:hypothetical protein